MEQQFGNIETLIGQLNDLDRAQSLCASLSWSFAMSIGQITARLLREDFTDEEAIQRLEQRREEISDLLAWSVRQANPDYIPSPADVVQRLQEGQTQTFSNEDMIELLVDQLGVSKDDVRRAEARNVERAAKEASLQAESARANDTAVMEAVRSAMHSYPGDLEVINQVDAIKITDRIADKAADYADNVLANALRQKRERRRKSLVAEYQLLKDIERQADELLDRLQHERDAVASDDEPTSVRA